MAVTRGARLLDGLTIGVWAAVLVGLVEGLVLWICVAFPPVLAAGKVSIHILWIAPTVNLVLFVPAAAILMLAVPLVERWVSRDRALYAAFLALGLITLLTAPAVLHPVAAGLLGLGITAATLRKLHGSEAALTARLRSRLWTLPIIMATVVAGVFAGEWASEAWRARALPAARRDAPNVLVIVMDTVRRDRFARGGARSLTPNLDRLSQRGLVASNAWSTTSWSLPSQASILTGRYPQEHAADWPGFRLDPTRPMLPDVLAQHGYVTGAFSGNAAWVTPAYLGRGFLRFDAYTIEDLLGRTVHGRKVERALWEIGYHTAGLGKKAPEINRELLRFVEDYPERPFFAYLCYMDVNQAFHHRRLNHPFWQPNPSVADVVDAYDHGLERLDADIGSLLRELERRGLLDRTLTIVTSDHGESFGEGSDDDHDPPGHGTSLYAEQLRVPLILLPPGGAGDRRVLDRDVSVRAIPATIMDMLGLGGAVFPGPSLWPAAGVSGDAPVSAATAPPRRDEDRRAGPVPGPLLATLDYDRYHARSVISDGLHYVLDLGVSPPHEALFDVRRDPAERHDLAFRTDVDRMRRDLARLSGADPAPAAVLRAPAR